MTIYYKINNFLTSLQNSELKSPINFISNNKDFIRSNSSFFNQKSILKKQAFIFHNTNFGFENEFKELKEKIFEYIKNDIQNNSFLPTNTKVYVAIDKKQKEIVSSYSSILFSRISEKNNLKKNTAYNTEREFDYANLYFYSFRKKRNFLQYSRRRRLNFINLYQTYERLLGDNSFNERFFLKEDESIKQNAIVLGFLNKPDALLYKKEIINKRLILGKERRKIRKRLKIRLNFFIKVKPTTLSNIQNSLVAFEDYKRSEISNKLILIPKFFSYNSNKNKQKVSINFPSLMLSNFGFIDLPIYKTKQISKKFLSATNKNSNDLFIPRKYFKTKTFFTTLDKQEYEDLSKSVNKKLFFYKQEKDFTDNVRNLINDRNKIYLNQIQEILIKIKKKSKTIEKFKKIKEFIFNHYDEKNLLEKTSYYIDKICKNNLKTSE